MVKEKYGAHAGNIGIYKSWAEGSTIGSKSLISFRPGRTYNVQQ